MATTKLSDIINPQVMGDMIDAKIEALCKLTPYAKVDTTLQGVPGDTKTVPSWNYVGDAEDFDVEGAADSDTELSTAKLTAGRETFTIKCIAKSISILQTAINSGLGDPVGQAESQLSKSIAGKIDNDVLAAAYKGTNVHTPATAAVIGYDGVVDAVTKFEDEEDGIEKVMFIHPKQEATLLKDDDFLSADKFVGGVAVNGAIGKIAGCWIKKSKKVVKVEYTLAASSGTGIVKVVASGASTGEVNLADVKDKAVWDATNKKVVYPAVDMYIKAVTNAYYLNPIIKMEPDSSETEYTEAELPAITIFLKKDTQVDHEWFPKKQRHDITAAKYCGVAKTNDAKIVLAEFKA